MPGGDVFPLFSKERRVVDSEQHTHGRFVDRYGRQTIRFFKISDGIPNIKTIDSTDGTQISCHYLVYLFFSHPGKSENIFRAGFLQAAVSFDQCDGHIGPDHSTAYTSYGYPAYVVRIIDGSDLQLQTSLGDLRRGDGTDHLIQ